MPCADADHLCRSARRGPNRKSGRRQSTARRGMIGRALRSANQQAVSPTTGSVGSRLQTLLQTSPSGEPQNSAISECSIRQASRPAGNANRWPMPCRLVMARSRSSDRQHDGSQGGRRTGSRPCRGVFCILPASRLYCLLRWIRHKSVPSRYLLEREEARDQRAGIGSNVGACIADRQSGP